MCRRQGTPSPDPQQSRKPLSSPCVRGLKALDYSLNRSHKDSEKSKVGFDFYLDISFDDLELTDSFLEKGRNSF